MKMSLGIFLQGLAFSLMVWAAMHENGQSSTRLSQLPTSMKSVGDDGEIYFWDAPSLTDDTNAFDQFGDFDSEKEQPMIAQGGRMRYRDGKLGIRGVMDENHRDRILRGTVNPEFAKEVRDFALETLRQERAGDEISLSRKLPAAAKIFNPYVLQGYNPKKLSWDTETQTLTAHMAIDDKDYKQILLAGANQDVQTALNYLFVQSAHFKVGSSWLFWFYILCTLGELCLSPVGLSMVSKLAPRKFATMLMGMWLLTSFFGNFMAGLAGESWELLEPQNYFLYVAVAMFIASVVCFLLTHLITRMMHGVK